MQTIDFDTQENFEFVFDIALAPEFNAELTSQDTIDFYTITVSDEMVNSQVDMYAQRAAKYEKVEEYQDRDMVKGLMAELDENGNTKEGGIQIEGSVMMPSYMKNDDQKAIFNGAKVNDVLVFNPNTAFDGNEAELSTLLNRGPRGGLILTNDEEIAKKINKAIFPGIQGGPLEHILRYEKVIMFPTTNF